MFCKMRKPVSMLILLLVVSLATGCFGLWKKTYSLKVTFNEEYGTVEGIPPKSDKLKEGTILKLKAVAKQGYVFDKWEGVPEGMEGDNPFEIALEKNMDIKAVFVERVGPAPTYQLTVTFDEEQGSVEGIPENPDEVEEGTEITLRAVPKEGFVFDKWTGVPEGKEKANPVEIIINSNTIITVDFAVVVIKPEEDFEGFELEASIGSMGWNAEDKVAVVVDDPLSPGNKVLKFTAKNYNAVPVIELTIPEGKTLADYSTFTFKGYFKEGDVGWKDIWVAVYTEEPSGALEPDDEEIIGSTYRDQGAGTEWEDIILDITNESDIAGKIYVAFGMSTKGTKSEGGEMDSVWYADDVKFVEKTE